MTKPKYTLAQAKKLNNALHRRCQEVEGENARLSRHIKLMLEDRQNWIKTADHWCNKYWLQVEVYNKLRWPSVEVPVESFDWALLGGIVIVLLTLAGIVWLLSTHGLPI